MDKNFIDILNEDFKSYDIILKILLRYIKSIMSNNDNYFICVPGLEDNFIEYLHKNILLENNSDEFLKIIPVKVAGTHYDFHKAVIARNDKDVKKIIILTNRTISLIDSLKDFVEIDIKKIKYDQIHDTLNSVLEEELGTDFTNFFNPNVADGALGEKTNDIKNYKNHIASVFNELKPELSYFIKYIIKIVNDYKKVIEFKQSVKSTVSEIKYLIMNTNLDMLGIWTSLSHNYIGKPKFKKMVRCSNPLIIENKIYDPEDINERKVPDTGISKDKNLIRILKGKYYKEDHLREILKNKTKRDKSVLSEVYYEFVESFFIGETSIKVKSKTKKETVPFSNLYDTFLDFITEEDNDLDDFEYIKFEEVYFYPNQPQTIDGIFCRMEMEFHSFLEQSLMNNKSNREDETSIFKINVVIKTKSDREITKTKRYDCESLIKYYEEFIKEVTNFNSDVLLVNKKDGNETINVTFENISNILQGMNLSNEEKGGFDRLLHELVEKRREILNTRYTYFDFNRVPYAIEYARIYFELLRNIHSLKNRAIEFRESGILNTLINIDSVVEDRQIRVACFNPVNIYYSHAVRKQYIEYILNYKKFKGLWRGILEDINHQYKNERTIYKNQLYYFNPIDFSDNRYFHTYIPSNSIDSFIDIDTYRIYGKIIEYKSKFPYKNTISIGIMGKVDALKLKKLLVNVLKRVDSNISQFNINFISIAPDLIRSRFLEDSESQEKLRQCVKYSFTNLNDVLDKERVIESLVWNNDIVFLLDPLLMYSSIEIQTIDNNIVEARSSRRTIESDIEILSTYSNFSRHDIPVMPELFNTIQILDYYGRNSNGIWYNYNLNPNFIRTIKESLLETSGMIKDKVVFFYSGDSEIIRQIYDFSGIEDIEKDVSEANEISVITFKPTSRKQLLPQKGHCNTVFSMGEYLGSFAGIDEELITSYGEDNYILEYMQELEITINYDQLPDELVVIVKLDGRYNLDVNQTDVEGQIESTLLSFIMPALRPSSNIEQTIKGIFLNYLASKSNSVGELLFIYMLRKYPEFFSNMNLNLSFNISDIENSQNGEEQSDNMSKSYMLNLISILDSKASAEREERKMENIFNNPERLRQALIYLKDAYNSRFVSYETQLKQNLDNRVI